MASMQTFNQLKAKGIAAYRAGDFPGARPYLIRAAKCLAEIAEGIKNPATRVEYEEIIGELIELAKECEERKLAKSTHRAKEGDDGADASDWVVREKPDISFDDIAGLDDVKHEIRMMMLYPFLHPDLAQEFGISVGGGVLLYGPPGTGKTMLAKAIATEIDATMFVISPAQILSKWVGEAEQNIRKLFDAAKAETKSVIFIDEIEALVPKRKSSGSTVMQRVVPQILQEMEGFDREGDRCLLLCGATNKPWMLDEAMMRPGRFDAKVYIPLPDAAARFKLLELNTAKRPVDDDVDFNVLVDRLKGYSGADIKEIIKQAAQIPFMEAIVGRMNGGESKRKISMADIETTMKEIKPSVKPGDLAKYEKFAAET